jgi:L,D-transpeptidase ErfK/SrfK
MPRLLPSVVLIVAALLSRPASGQEPIAAGRLTGGIVTYEVHTGDTLAALSARFGTGIPVLLELNKLKRDDPLLPGRVLTIDNRHLAVVDPAVAIIINLAQRMLFFGDGETLTAYPVAVGLRSWPTPVGAFTIVDKEENPTWDVPQSIQDEMRSQGKPVITRMPPSPENPLGAHWIRLSLTSIGIHGTIAPSSVYRYASHGCIRMHPDDVAALYARVAVGMTGVSVYQPVVMARINDRVFLEAHPDGYRRAPKPLAYVRSVAGREGFADLVNWPAVAIVLRQQRGIAVDVTKDD